MKKRRATWSQTCKYKSQKKHFSNLGMDHIRCLAEQFDESLDLILEKVYKVDDMRESKTFRQFYCKWLIEEQLT